MSIIHLSQPELQSSERFKRVVRSTPGIYMPRMKAYVIQPAGGQASSDLEDCEKSIKLSASTERLTDEIHETDYSGIMVSGLENLAY